MSDQSQFPKPVPAMPVAAAPTNPAPSDSLPSRAQAGNGVSIATRAPSREPTMRGKAKTVKAAPKRKVRAVKTVSKKKPAKRRPAHKTAPQPAPAKNPNRPLEMKSQLQAVLAMSSVLSKPEMAIFATAMQGMQELSRNSRRRVIAALAQVYP